jgi:hypothetical protein
MGCNFGSAYTDFFSRIKQPLSAHDFLRSFSLKLDPSSGHGEGSGMKASQKRKAAVEAIKVAALGRSNSLHRMSVFGLKYCQLSKKSVAFLEVRSFYTSPRLYGLHKHLISLYMFLCFDL